ncbi:MAG: palindromic element RPE1 domain-containing protein [Candidatus Tisiphia sp.]
MHNAEGFKEATKPRPTADNDVREEQSIGSTNKLPAEVEFGKDIHYIFHIIS